MSPATYVIPDIHLRYHWIDEMLKQCKRGRFIFLGDYFDNYNDSPEENAGMAHWLKKHLRNPRLKFIIGNHDMNYLPGQKKFRKDGGFAEENFREITKILKMDDFDRLKYFVVEQGWLLSHAGVHRSVFRDLSPANMHSKLNWARKEFLRGGNPEALGPIGITWLRWHRFQPISSLNQIVGHSPNQIPRRIVLIRDRKDSDYEQMETSYGDKGEWLGTFDEGRDLYTASDNWCIDTQNKYIGILRNGNFKVIKNPFELPPERPAPPLPVKIPHHELLHLLMDEEGWPEA